MVPCSSGTCPNNRSAWHMNLRLVCSPYFLCASWVTLRDIEVFFCLRGQAIFFLKILNGLAVVEGC